MKTSRFLSQIDSNLNCWQTSNRNYTLQWHCFFFPGLIRLRVPKIPAWTTQLVWQSTRVTITNVYVFQDMVEGTAKQVISHLNLKRSSFSWFWFNDTGRHNGKLRHFLFNQLNGALSLLSAHNALSAVVKIPFKTITLGFF